MSPRGIAPLAQNLARVRRVRAELEAGRVPDSSWVVRIRGYGSRLIPSDVAAAEALTDGESVKVQREPLRGSGFGPVSDSRTIAPLDTTSHPHC